MPCDRFNKPADVNLAKISQQTSSGYNPFMPTNRKLRAVAGQGAFAQANAVLNLGAGIFALIGAFNALPVLKPMLAHYLPKTLLNMKLAMKIGPLQSVNVSDVLFVFLGFVLGYAVGMLIMVLCLNVVSAARGAMAGSGEE